MTTTHRPEVVLAGRKPAGLRMGSGSLPADEFRRLSRGHPRGVAAITAAAPHGPAAPTAASVSPGSADPPLLTFSLSSLSPASPTISSASTVVVHLLDAD